MNPNKIPINIFKKNKDLIPHEVEILDGEKAKKEIIKHTELLNSKAELVGDINQLISESHAYLKPINNALTDVITSKDTVVKVATFWSFKKNSKSIENEVNSFIQKLSLKSNALDISSVEYEEILLKIKELQKYIDNESKFHRDIAGIISFNELRILEMKNLKIQTSTCIETLEQFKVSTLYHLRETIKNELLNKNPDKLISNEIATLNHRIAKLTNRSMKLIKAFLFTFIITTYNYCTHRYNFIWNREKEIYSNSIAGSHLESELTEHVTSMYSFMSTALIVASTISFIMVLMKIAECIQDRNKGLIGLMMNLIFLIIFMIVQRLISLEPEGNLVAIHHITHTVSFYNFGSTGNVFFNAILLIMVAFYIFTKEKTKRNLNRMNKITKPIFQEEVAGVQQINDSSKQESI